MSRCDSPQALRLVRGVDEVLAASGYHLGRVDTDTDHAAGLVAAWRAAGQITRARVLLFLVQRAGDAVDTAVNLLSGLVAPVWVRWALAAARTSSALTLVDVMVDADPADTDPGPTLGAALLLASLVHAPDTPACGFCRIAAGQDPDVQVIDERDESVAFVPRSGGVVPGHWLVIPRVHVPDAVAVPDVTADVMRHAAALAREQGPDAVNIITSVGAAATQTVRHLHVHLVPRETGDGLALPWDPYALQGRLRPDALAAVGDPVADALDGVQRASQDILVDYAVRAHDMDEADAARFVAWLWPRREAVSPTGRTTWAALVGDALEVWRHHHHGRPPVR